MDINTGSAARNIAKLQLAAIFFQHCGSPTLNDSVFLIVDSFQLSSMQNSASENPVFAVRVDVVQRERSYHTPGERRKIGCIWLRQQ